MTPLDFDYKLRCGLLTLRQRTNKAAQCMNFSAMALENAVIACRKSQLRLQASTMRLQRCLEAHGV